MFLFNLKKHAKSRFKNGIRRLKRRHHYQILVRSKIASAFSNKQSRNFWTVIRSLNKSRGETNHVPIVDGVTGVNDIANCFTSKLNSRLNTHPGLSANAFHSFDSSLFASQLSEVNVFVDDLLNALESLKPGKT